MTLSEAENMSPNAHPARKRNPFKGQDRMAFPPLEDALARVGAVRGGSDEEKDDGSGERVLTISMQALIHPDSFSVLQSESMDDEEDDGGEAGGEWEVGCIEDMLSPERDPDMPEFLRAAEEGEEEESDGSDAEPCMADFFLAQMEYGNQHLSPVQSDASASVASDGASFSSSQGFIDKGSACAGGTSEVSGLGQHLNLSEVSPCPTTPVCKRNHAVEHQTPKMTRTPRTGDAVRTPTVCTPTTPLSVLKVRISAHVCPYPMLTPQALLKPFESR